MRCDEARPLLSADLDGEANGTVVRLAHEHARDCPHCRDAVAGYRDIGRDLARHGREPLPPRLAESIRDRIAREMPEVPQRPERVSLPPLRTIAWRAAAAILIAAVSALAGWQYGRTGVGLDTLERDILAAHVRSLLQASPIDVASSSTHSVKPWFAGRLEFAPEVKDLSTEGFSLVGGRVEYVGERRVAALVYKRRLHVINVMMWPAAGKERTQPRAISIKGYNAVTWSSGGMTYWAISDLNTAELSELASRY